MKSSKEAHFHTQIERVVEMNRLPHKPHIYFANGRWHVGAAYGAWTGRAVIERNTQRVSRSATKSNTGDK